MLPVLPFVVGVVAGASAIGLVRKVKISPRVSDAWDTAERKIRKAAVSGLDTIRQSSEQWRDRLADAPAAKKETPVSADASPKQKTSPSKARSPRAAKKN